MNDERRQAEPGLVDGPTGGLGLAAGPGPAGERGYALIFALAVMLVLLIVGLRFVAVVHARQMATDNEKKALQACLLADSALARATRELSEDMSWSGSYPSQSLGGGWYSVSVTGSGPGYVTVRASGTYGGTTRDREARVYTMASAAGSAIVWANCYGTGTNEWTDPWNLIDWSDGEYDTYAYHKLGEGADQMSLGGFASDIRSATITKVEVVVSGYVFPAPVDDELMVCWYQAGSATSGQWHVWSRDDLATRSLLADTGQWYLDVTADAPAGGWQWRHFYHGTDLELRCASARVDTDDGAYLYVDCAGFRVTWDASK